ncbi:hypothetical protein ACFY3G_19065 [Streptomyces phaeochromogenes]|uniref:hypothetical protein n=1 Tax=Streptomyces phaeochromogenes TaxID=1923 RepID=UPI0036C007E3
MSRGEALIGGLQRGRLLQAGFRLSQEVQRRRRDVSQVPTDCCGPFRQILKARYQRLWNAGGRQRGKQPIGDRSHHSFDVGDLIERLVYECYRLLALGVRGSREVKPDFCQTLRYSR